MILWWFFCKAAPVVLYNTYCRWALYSQLRDSIAQSQLHTLIPFSVGILGLKHGNPSGALDHFTFLRHSSPTQALYPHRWAISEPWSWSGCNREREGGRQTEKGTCLDKEIQLRPPITDKAQTPWPDASAEGKNAQCVLAQWAVTSKFGLVFRWSRMSLCANSEGSTAHFCRTGSHMTLQHTALHHTLLHLTLRWLLLVTPHIYFRNTA